VTDDPNGRLSANHAEEFARFYRRSSKATLGRAYRVAGGDKQVAQDAVQDAYLRAMQRWEKLRSLAYGQQCRWLGQAVTYVLMDRWRKDSRSPVLLDLSQAEEHAMAAVPPPGADQLERVEWYRQVCAAAATRLHGRQREVFALHCLAGYEMREIALMLGIGRATARVHLSNARRQLAAADASIAAIREALHMEGTS